MCKSRQHFMFLSIEFQRLLHGVATPANSGAYSQSAMITSDKTLMKVFSDIISFSMSAGLQQLYLHLLPKLIAYCQCLYMENWKGIVGKRRRSKDILGPCVRYWSKKNNALLKCLRRLQGHFLVCKHFAASSAWTSIENKFTHFRGCLSFFPSTNY